jgi:hypothetical protein
MPRLNGNNKCYMLTADDDAYYPPDWLASFVEVAINHPKAIVAGRARLAKFDATGRAEDYGTWELPADPSAPLPPSTKLFPTGVGGVLYPPGSLDNRATDRATFMELCPEGDDIWLFWMARLAGTEHRQASRQWRDIVWKGTKQTALWGSNIEGGGNMRQIRAMEAHFGPVP